MKQNQSKLSFKLDKSERSHPSSAGAALLRVKEHVQSEPWLQAESDASWELHGEDPGHLAGWERIVDWAHILLRRGPK